MGFRFFEETRFKETEIGLIPEDWQVVRLGEVADISSGGSAPQGEFYFGGKNFFIRVSHIDNTDNSVKGADLITDEAVRKYKLKRYPKGTIIFPKSGATIYLEKRAQLPFDAYIVSHLCAVISNKENLKQDFLFYVLLKTKFAEKKGDGYPTLNLSEIKQFFIPLPSLPEQKATAEVLRTIQEAKEKTEAVIKAAKEFKKSMMKHLFKFGVNRVNELRVERVDRVNELRVEGVEGVHGVNELRVERVDRVNELRVNGVERVERVGELKETEIGLIPKHWQVVRLREVCEKTKQIDSRKNPDLQFKYIDVSSINNKLFKIENYTYYIGKDAPHRARKRILANDIIFATVRPYLKRIAIVDEKFNEEICSTAFCVIRTKKYIVDHRFVFYYLTNDKFVNAVSEHQRGSSYPAITDKDVLNGLIPLPPLSEQKAIAEILQAIDEKIQKEEAKKQAIENLFKTMLSNLMSGRIRVNRVES